jgi:coproporphyrinogen III oxidase-like Fe-S oxidoreductase
VTADMYRLADQMLTAAGYEHYEISNYAKPGYQCRHNRVYWENRPFYGFGMGATSYWGGDRVARPRQLQAYYDWVNDYPDRALNPQSSNPQSSNPQSSPKSNAPPDPPPDSSSRAGAAVLTAATTIELLLDTLMLGLRLAEGVDLQRLTSQFGQSLTQQVMECLKPYETVGWVDFTGDDRVCLTHPEGFLFSNVMLTRLFAHFGADDVELG